MKIAFVSTFDSFLRANRMLASALGEEGAVCEHLILRARAKQISESQIAGILGKKPTCIQPIAETISYVIEHHYDWMILSAENTTCRRFLFYWSQLDSPTRPYVATIYPGIIFRHHYDGFSARMPADLVILNSQRDQRLYRNLRKSYGCEDDNSFVLGPITTLGVKHFKPGLKRDTVIFFDQPSVPATPEEKTYIFEQLSSAARKFPQFKFYVKLRVKPGENTLHKGGQATLKILEKFNKSQAADEKPLEMIEGDCRHLLERCALALSVSSTALIEAVACGCSALSITDFGIDDEYGASFFIGSGLSGNLPDCDPCAMKKPADDWMEDNIGNSDAGVESLYNHLNGFSSDRSPRPTTPFYGSKEFVDFAISRFGPHKGIARTYRRKSWYNSSTLFLRRIKNYFR
ncbi:MAG: DUF6716 putative glycosyltransferase [Verrucomicrobiota bacterium]